MSRSRRHEELGDDLSGGEGDGERYHGSTSSVLTRNLVGFWLLGLCNNFAYVIMLSAAKDILEDGHHASDNTTADCRDSIISRNCQPLSTGSVLLADILPALFIKVSAPLFIHSVPFETRTLFVVIIQAASFLLVATSSTVPGALLGVVLASFGSGLGEVSFLSLASFFNIKVISTWSSGTGGAGIFGALAYAILTDKALIGLSPSNTLLSMLIVPLAFAFTYWFVLAMPRSVHRVKLLDPHTYFVPNVDTVCGSSRNRVSSFTTNSDDEQPLMENGRADSIGSAPPPSTALKLHLMLPLLKYMIPLIVVYFGEYFINQGLVELLEFDCSHGFGLGVASQYRWYQVLYQLGVFISRSSSDCVTIPSAVLPVFALLQLVNATLLYFDAVYYFIPHISILFLIILYEGLLGGAAYVNTFRAIHKEIAPEARQFSMGFASIADTLGIVFSGFAAIPVHNYICSLSL